jgi:membrane protein implicated in regulation of membrane protease activity
MESWWEGISVLNKAFAIAALAFTVVFVWQILLMIIGMDGDAHSDAGGGGSDHAAADSTGHEGTHQSVHGDAHGGEAATFTFLSIRSLVGFGTLFSWAGTLYLAGGTSPVWAVLYSLIWGFVAMFAVTYTLQWIVRQQERGNASIWTALGEEGWVYITIPEGGPGKVRVKVSGAISFVNARSRQGTCLSAGTKVRVVGVLNENTLEVEAIEDHGEG